MAQDRRGRTSELVERIREVERNIDTGTEAVWSDFVWSEVARTAVVCGEVLPAQAAAVPAAVPAVVPYGPGGAGRQGRPHRDLAGGVAHPPTQRQCPDDAQTPTSARGERRTRRLWSRRPAAVGHLYDKGAVSADTPSRPDSDLLAAIHRAAAGDRPRVPAGVAQQLRKDQYRVVDDGIRDSVRGKFLAQPSPRLNNARRTMGQGHSRRRRHLLGYHQRHPRDLLNPTPRDGCPSGLHRKPSNCDLLGHSPLSNTVRMRRSTRGENPKAKETRTESGRSGNEERNEEGRTGAGAGAGAAADRTDRHRQKQQVQAGAGRGRVNGPAGRAPASAGW